MMARNTNVPLKGRIQKRKTYHLQIITFRLQRAAGPYRSASSGREQLQRGNPLFDHDVGAQQEGFRDLQPDRLCRLEVDDQLEFRGLLNWNVFGMLAL
jgi:hypothetical protein